MDARFPVLSEHVDTKEPSRSRASTRVIILAVTLLAGLYALPFVQRGWFPHDEGMLGQCAERILQGEVPHRDFDDPYTGGLSYLNAAAFRLFGTRLVSLRFPLFVIYLGFVATLCAVALRLAAPVPAVLVTLLGAAWSLPNYFAAVPSWYNLFLAVFGIWALARYWETKRLAFLLLSGILGGISILIKITGVYFVAAVVAALLLPPDGSARALAAGVSAGGSLRWFRGLAVVPLAALPFLVVKRPGLSEFLHFVLPVLLTLLALVLYARRRHDAQAARRVFPELALYGAAAALPVVVFAVAYWVLGDLPRLYRAILVLPVHRLEFASRPPALARLLFAIPYGALVLASQLRLQGRRRAAVVAALACILLLLLAEVGHDLVRGGIWLSVAGLPIVAAIALVQRAARSQDESLGKAHDPRLVFVLVSASTYCALVQFPFSSMLYFCYVAPLLALAMLALVGQGRSRPLHGVIAGFYLAFAVVALNPGYGAIAGRPGLSQPRLFRREPPYIFDSRLDAGRAGLLVTAEDADTYRRLVQLVRSKARSGYIYAGPDCPEVYFLCGARNPTRAIFDFLEHGNGQPPDLVRQLTRKSVTVAVVNTEPGFSPRITESLRAELAREFPHSLTVGRFDVRWKQ